MYMYLQVINLISAKTFPKSSWYAFKLLQECTNLFVQMMMCYFGWGVIIPASESEMLIDQCTGAIWWI